MIFDFEVGEGSSDLSFQHFLDLFIGFLVDNTVDYEESSEEYNR